jgi:hypothetical protein
VTALKDKPKGTKCSDQCRSILFTHVAQTIARIFRRTETKIEDVLGEDRFGFRRGKRTRDAIWMLRIISERTLDINEGLFACWVRPSS